MRSGAGSRAAEFGPEQFVEATGVSRGTLERLIRYEQLCRQWQERLNLIGRSTLPDIWHRHFWDAAQILDHVPCAREVRPALTWLDLGSGAGFPGLVIAIMGAGHVHLVEKSPRKCQFLRAVAAATDAPVTIHQARAEDVTPGPVDVITARAFAPLPRLLTQAYPFFSRDTIALLHKGQNLDDELTEATKYWKMHITSAPSVTDQRGRIMRVENLTPCPTP